MKDHIKVDEYEIWIIKLIGLEDVDAYSQSIDEDMISVYYTIVVNLIICILCVLFFSFFRRYAPENLKNRLYSPKVDIVPQKTPPRLQSDSLFGWVYDVYRFLNIYNNTNIGQLN